MTSPTVFTTDTTLSGLATVGTVQQIRAKVFVGVVGVDYILSSFSQFLQEQYGAGLEGENTKHVFIEEVDTGSMIANSLKGVGLYAFYGEKDASGKLVTDKSGGVATKTSQMRRRKTDDPWLEANGGQSIVRSSNALKKNEYKSDKTGTMLRIDIDDKPHHVQSFLYSPPGIKWRVVVVSPVKVPVQEMNYFPTGVTTLVAVLGTAAILCCAGTLIWMVYNRAHPGIVVMKLGFSSVVLLGCSLSFASVFTFMIDDNGYNQAQTNIACQLGPWYVLGV